MPASNIGTYLQEARNNINDMRPALICTDANHPIAQCQNMHVSTNCYYGYHNLKNLHTLHVDTDSEMVELEVLPGKRQLKSISRKRSAEEDEYPPKKRLREEVQREKNIDPETNETVKLDASTEDIMESLYWNIHGGHIFHLIQCL